MWGLNPPDGAAENTWTIYVHEHEHGVPQVEERRKWSEALKQVRVVAARPRNGRAQFGVAQGADHRQHAAHDPHGQAEADRSGLDHHARRRDEYTCDKFADELNKYLYNLYTIQCY